LKETEAKIRRAEEEKERKEKERQNRNTQKKKLMNTGDFGVMDNLWEALQNGDVFEMPQTHQRVKRVPREKTRDAANDFRRTIYKQNLNMIHQQ
jgi:hypothetical protein